jgi:hypothetical protein
VTYQSLHVIELTNHYKTLGESEWEEIKTRKAD